MSSVLLWKPPVTPSLRVNLHMAAISLCQEYSFWYTPESLLCFISTNKVYRDRPNQSPLIEIDSRWDYVEGRAGIGEDVLVDQCLHSLFGASKAAAGLLCQEFARYFGRRVGIFRGGYLTGPRHASVELHGYLNYIVCLAVHGAPYRIYGYKGKQVRDQIHACDVIQLFLEFFRKPRPGEVYTMQYRGLVGEQRLLPTGGKYRPAISR